MEKKISLRFDTNIPDELLVLAFIKTIKKPRGKNLTRFLVNAIKEFQDEIDIQLLKKNIYQLRFEKTLENSSIENLLKSDIETLFNDSASPQTTSKNESKPISHHLEEPVQCSTITTKPQNNNTLLKNELFNVHNQDENNKNNVSDTFISSFFEGLDIDDSDI